MPQNLKDDENKKALELQHASTEYNLVNDTSKTSVYFLEDLNSKSKDFLFIKDSFKKTMLEGCEAQISKYIQLEDAYVRRKVIICYYIMVRTG